MLHQVIEIFVEMITKKKKSCGKNSSDCQCYITKRKFFNYGLMSVKKMSAKRKMSAKSKISRAAYYQDHGASSSG